MSQPFLVVIGGSLAGRRLDLDLENMRNVSVGSDPACDFRLETAGVSALHARLWLDAQGPVIYPTSPGAVFVNNERVMNQERRLNDGDLITLGMPGDRAIRFRYCESEATETTAISGPGTWQTQPIAPAAGAPPATEALSPKAAQLRALLERKAAPAAVPSAVATEWIAPPADPGRPAVPVTTLPDVNAGLSPGSPAPTHTLPPMPPLEIDAPPPEPTARTAPAAAPEATVRMSAPAPAPEATVRMSAPAPAPAAQHVQPAVTPSGSSSMPLLAAAAVVVIALLGGGIYMLRSRGAAPPQVASAPPVTQAVAPPTLAEAPAETAEVPTETATAVVPAAETAAGAPTGARPAGAGSVPTAPRPAGAAPAGNPAGPATRPGPAAPGHPTAASRPGTEPAAHTETAKPATSASPAPAAGASRDADRGRFVAGTTRGDSTRTFNPSELKGFYTTDVRSKRRPGIDGRIEVAVTPGSVSSGDRYSVKFFLVNEGKKAIKIAGVTLTTTVNGSRSGGPLGAPTKEVPPQGRILVHEATGVWQQNTASWAAEIVVSAENGDHLSSEVVWR
jgi:hypothetical protein